MDAYRDHREWSCTVAEDVTPTDDTVDAIDMREVFNRSGFDSIDLLKVDIERSERVVFGPDARAWLPRVRNIVIELHDDECERAFFTAMAPFTFNRESAGDLTICLDIRPK